MRRAALFLCVALASICGPRLVLSQPASKDIDGSGMVSFAREPNFKVGSWVKYHTKGSSLQGFKDDYTVTILIAGEELWWGEPCFWIETWTQEGSSPHATASLVSYEAFGDSMSTDHLLWFLRKYIQGLDPQGNPEEMLYKRDRGEFKSRGLLKRKPEVPGEFERDTLGTEKVATPAGAFEALKVVITTKQAEGAQKGDSTIAYRRKEERTIYVSDEIPITRMVREDIDDLQEGKTWLTGQSNNDPLHVLERARGTTELVGYGHDGVKPMLVPEKYQHSIKEQQAAQDKAAAQPKPAPPKSPAPRKGVAKSG